MIPSVRDGIEALFELDHRRATERLGRAVGQDRECAMAWWALAVASLRLPDGGLEDEAWPAIDTFLARAAAGHHVSALERELIDATRPLADRSLPPFARLQAAATSLARLAGADGAHALAAPVASLLWLSASTVPGDRPHEEAARQLARWARFEGSRRDAPAVPAVTLLAVLAFDQPAWRDEALVSAGALVAGAPRAWRAWEAAAQVFLRAGRHLEAATAAWEALARTGGVAAQPVLADVPWCRHPLPWLIRAESRLGRFVRARMHYAGALDEFHRQASVLTPHLVWRLRALIELTWVELRWASLDWQQQPTWPADDIGPRFAADKPPFEALPADTRELVEEAEARRAWLEGLLAGRAAWPRGEPERLATARAAAARLEALASRHPVPPVYDLMRTQVLAAVATALEAREELRLLGDHAVGLEQQVRAAGAELRVPTGTARVLGEMWLLLRDDLEARALFEGRPGLPCDEPRCVLGLARALARAGERAGAAAAYSRFLDLWGSADEVRSEVAEARRGAAPR